MKRTRRNHAIKPVWLDYFDPHELLCGAARYYMGRKTISGCCFAEELAAAWLEIPQHTRTVIQRDLESHFRFEDKLLTHSDKIGPMAFGMDRTAWEKVRQAWEAMQ